MSSTDAPATDADRVLRRRSERHRLPTIDVLTSAVGWGPIPFRHLSKAQRMFEERIALGTAPDEESHTPLERAIRSKPELRAEQLIIRTVEHDIEPRVRSITDMAAQRNAIVDEIQRIENQPCMDLTGESLSLQDARVRAKEVAASIEADERRGSVKHRTSSKASRRRLLGFIVADFALLVYFMTRTLNVDILQPQHNPISAVVAVAVTVLLARRSRRAVRDHHGQLRFRTDRGQARDPAKSNSPAPHGLGTGFE